MRIGIRAHDMESAPLDEIVKDIHDKGFLCAQLALQKVIHSFPVLSSNLSPGMASYIKNIFIENKVDIAVLGCYHNLANPYKPEFDEIVETYLSHIRFAHYLGCGLVGTETGAVNRNYTYEPENHSVKSFSIFVENLKVIIDYAEKLGVVIGIEPVFNHIIYDIERTYQVLSAIKSPNLQVIFDPVNLLNYNNYKEQDDIIKGAFELLNKDIAVIHAKDFIVEEKNLSVKPAGQGIFNFDLFLNLIKKNKPYIHVLLENTNSSNMMEAKYFIENKYFSIEINDREK
ncbi:MAG: Xylose isomerase domain protein barrel [Anaerocolumna sp.]|jgi:sugar phosphate isomerase/epimerase|nr:Xylose isomerase domain protein barrel [Anaerocolumna sp.]